MTYPDFLKCVFLEECDSTNSYVKQNYEMLSKDLPVLVSSTAQSLGRGRDQRIWVSLKNKGLYSSFAFTLRKDFNFNLLPLISGIAVIETLKVITGIEMVLKWPNDILWENKKISGILIENIISENTIFCIAGIGINLNYTVDDFHEDLKDKITSIKMITGEMIEPKKVNPLLAGFFFHWLEKLEAGNDKKIIHLANRYSHPFRGEKISFHPIGEKRKIMGIFKGINHDGGLILEIRRLAGRIHKIYYSGEINN